MSVRCPPVLELDVVVSETELVLLLGRYCSVCLTLLYNSISITRIVLEQQRARYDQRSRVVLVYFCVLDRTELTV